MTAAVLERPKTQVINVKHKEFYYQAEAVPLKESPEILKHRYTLWNYMMNVSMQNTVSQMMKRRGLN